MADAKRSPMKRPTLRALAKSRGLLGASVSQTFAAGSGYLASADSGCPFNDRGVECYAPTRRAATEGLRAALLALPEVKKERKR